MIRWFFWVNVYTGDHGYADATKAKARITGWSRPVPLGLRIEEIVWNRWMYYAEPAVPRTASDFCIVKCSFLSREETASAVKEFLDAQWNKNTTLVYVPEPDALEIIGRIK